MPEHEEMPIPEEPQDAADAGASGGEDLAIRQMTQAYEQLAQKVAELEDLISGRILTLEERERQLRLAEISQRMSIRKWTALIAAAAAFSMIVMLVVAKFKVGLWWLIWAPDAYSVATIVAPTLSATTIVAALLWGAFRRFKDDDPERIASSAPINTAINSMSGGQ